MYPKDAGRIMTTSADPDQEQSDLSLQSLPRSVCEDNLQNNA